MRDYNIIVDMIGYFQTKIPALAAIPGCNDKCSSGAEIPAAFAGAHVAAVTADPSERDNYERNF